MTAHRSRVAVVLTGPQADAVIAALAYFTAGSPADVGQEDNAEGFRVLRNAQRAFDAVHAAAAR